MPYRDMREYLGVLERAGKLKRITREVDKDWELAAVTRTVFQKVPERVRPALLFERVKGFDIPVAVGILGGSGAIYALALETEEERVWERWRDAQAHPIPPVLVPDGPCKEHVLKGEEADLRAFPHPVWTPGRDPSPYITAGCVCTRDPETGQQNVGTYRVQIQEKDQAGIYINVTHGGARHISKNEAAGRPTELAIVLGADPVVGLVGVSTVATSLDELAVAGGLRGQPLEVVKGETVDLEVPATAEIVIEGIVPCGGRKWEGPFGEFTGYMGPAGNNYHFEVTGITHRDRPIYHGYMSQMPPSESSCMRRVGFEAPLRHHLRSLGLQIRDVHYPESGCAAYIILVSMRKRFEGEPKQAIWGTWAFDPRHGKLVIVVDEDIDIRDPFAVDWALSVHMQPHRDIHIEPDTPSAPLDPSLVPAGVAHHERSRMLGSKVGIDATRKHAYPEVALPAQEYLDRVRRQWREYGFD